MDSDIPQGRQRTKADAAIGARIRHIRKLRGLTQIEMAQGLGVTFQQIQKYERGRNRIPAFRLVGIARLLDTNPHELLDWSGDVVAQAVETTSRKSSMDYKATNLWNRIRSDRYRRALILLMKVIGDESERVRDA